MKVHGLIFLGLLSGCAGWPQGSYVAHDYQGEAPVLVPAIAECTSYIVPLNTPVTMVTAGNDPAFAALLPDALLSNAVTPQKEGHKVTYVVGKLDEGVFISVSSPPKGRCGQYFSRNEAGTLIPSGSMMVTK